MLAQPNCWGPEFVLSLGFEVKVRWPRARTGDVNAGRLHNRLSVFLGILIVQMCLNV